MGMISRLGVATSAALILAGCGGGGSDISGAMQVECPETRALNRAAGLGDFNQLDAYEGDALTVKDGQGQIIASVTLQGLTGVDGTPGDQLPSIEEALARGESLVSCHLPFVVEGVEADFVSFELRGVQWTGVPVADVEDKKLVFTNFSSPSWKLEEPPA